jgi:enoyl-CoA hydratase
MSHNNLALERRGNVAVVTINRPEKMNAFDESLFISLESVTADLKKLLPRAVVITGAGNVSFSSGFDVNPENPMVKRIIEAASKKDSEPARELISAIRKSIDGFLSVPVPLIAAINGSAFGGGAEFAMRCDLRVMDPDSIICFSETKLGLMPDWGGGVALAAVAGPSRAADLILTARKVGADEAYSMGLVNRISTKGNALAEAVIMAERIAANGPLAVRSSLKLIRERYNRTDIELLKMEAELAASLVSSGECFHGVGAFLEKRDPVFPDIN